MSDDIKARESKEKSKKITLDSLIPTTEQIAPLLVKEIKDGNLGMIKATLEQGLECPYVPEVKKDKTQLAYLQLKHKGKGLIRLAFEAGQYDIVEYLLRARYFQGLNIETTITRPYLPSPDLDIVWVYNQAKAKGLKKLEKEMRFWSLLQMHAVKLYGGKRIFDFRYSFVMISQIGKEKNLPAGFTFPDLNIGIYEIPNMPGYRYTPLDKAICQGNVAGVKFLYDRGFSLKKHPTSYLSPLCMAVVSEQLEMTGWLLAKTTFDPQALVVAEKLVLRDSKNEIRQHIRDMLKIHQSVALTPEPGPSPKPEGLETQAIAQILSYQAPQGAGEATQRKKENKERGKNKSFIDKLLPLSLFGKSGLPKPTKPKSKPKKPEELPMQLTKQQGYGSTQE